MTNQGDWLTGGKEGLDQLDRVPVFGEIPHRAVAARIEDGVEIFLLDPVKTDSSVKLSLRSDVLLEPERKVGPEFWLVALGIERGTTALRGHECDLSPGLLENVVGSSELLKPEAGLAPRIPELVVRSDNHQDFHDLLLLLGFHQRPKLLTPDRWGAITRYRDASIGMSSRNTWPEVRQNRSENGFAWLVV